MNLWDFVCMILIYASMLEFIIVNYLHRKVHYCSRPQSGDGDGGSGVGVGSGGRHLMELQSGLAKEELEVRAPLVSGGDEPATVAVSAAAGADSHVNHRQAPRQITAVIAGSSRPMTRPSSGVHSDERARAAASVFAWLRRPNIFQPQPQVTSQARLARSIDHVSKTVFPFLYGVFSFTFFAVFAGYLPSLLDEWIVNEYRAERSAS